MRHQRFIFVVVLLLCAAAVYAQTFGTKQRMPRPNEYGTVEIDNYSRRAGIAPVVFAHWLHRTKYTCRLCHVDLGFAMEAGQTEIREEDNRNGLYCGACHNGSEAFAVEEKKPGTKQEKNCQSCHSLGVDVQVKYDFYKFVKGFPRARFGNCVDWVRAL